jgi:hypothetical protein
MDIAERAIQGAIIAHNLDEQLGKFTAHRSTPFLRPP